MMVASGREGEGIKPATKTSPNPPPKDPGYTRVGVRGVRLKKFEEAVADLLPHVQPHFVGLPSFSVGLSSDWPFRDGSLPPRACVRGDDPGQLKGDRATRKEGQLRSMLQCVAAMLNHENMKSKLDDKPVTIVDFCGGTGHLAIPMALLFPQCKIVVVDLKAASLKLLHEKALKCSSVESSEQVALDSQFYRYQKGEGVTKHERIKRQCVGIQNLFTYHGSIETFQERFDIGVALHACGEATDVVLRSCANVHANFCVSSCCVGKLSRRRHNPYVYHATAGNAPSIVYPQSCQVSSVLEQEDTSSSSSSSSSHWDHLCQAADYSDLKELRQPRNATRRAAKALLETDRLLYMEHTYGYQTALTRMDPWEASPKNDILLGWQPANTRIQSPFYQIPMKADGDCNADVELARKHLLSTEESKDNDQVDWTEQEEREIRKTLEDFRAKNDQELVFPVKMGGRKRKLVHAVAKDMGLAHYCQGLKHAEKTVVVAKRWKNDDEGRPRS